MMVSQEERKRIRRFVCGQLRDETDLSALTLRILKRRYLAHVQSEELNSEAKSFLKQVVQEELMKMQDNEKNGSEMENTKLQNKRKREKENEVVMSGEEDESIAKKSRCQSSSSSETKDENETAGEESEGEEQIKSGSEEEEQEMNKSQRKTSGNSNRQINSEDSTDEERDESEKEENERNHSSEDMPKNKASTVKNGKTGSSNTSQGKKTQQSDEENDSDSDNPSERSDKIKGSDSSDDSDKEQASAEKKNDDSDSDSSSLPSLEDEKDVGKENAQDDKKKKTEKKEKSAKSQKNDDKAVVRLKRYITMCGAWRNYKKLLDGCRSVRSQVAVLKKELEDLGVHGQPSIEKCKKIRRKREQAQELAELDVTNIISTQGRPKRRGASAWLEQKEPPSSTYVRSLNSSSDSDQENETRKGHKRATDWANLQGIISDDANSD